MTDTAEKKGMLRRQVAALKQGLTSGERDRLSALILRQLESLDLFRKSQRILLYHALPDEVQTGPLLERWKQEKELLLPVVNGNDLAMVPFRDRLLTAGHFGILEPAGSPVDRPESIDLIVVPGIAFDREKNRMGRGRGFYDRLLSQTQVPCIGICFGFQLFDEIPCEPHDIRMAQIITETELF